MKRAIALLGLGLALVLVAAVAAVVRSAGPGSASASSHREAPYTSMDPSADNTDVYAFRSPDKTDTVTLVANFNPFEEPAGGPNFYPFDDTVLYEIHVDNNGDARPDITFQFRFRQQTRNPNTFLYNTGPITSLDDPDWNRPQLYSVTMIRNDSSSNGHHGSGATTTTVLDDHLSTPPANIGPRSTPNYEALAQQVVSSLPGGMKVFAGQRDDPFFIDIGSIFDLLGLRPFNSFHLIPLPNMPGVDGLRKLSVNSIALQVPISLLGSAAHNTIGVYASASRQTLRVLDPNANDSTSGPFVQVSRLGNPLVNEVVIPVGQKDRWNRQQPADDAQFETFFKNPEVARLVNLLYPALPDAPTTNRDDLVAVLLTGVPTLNYTGPTKADLLRLNFGIPVTANPNRLGVLAGDFQGFPNGRRLADDVTDIEIRAFACGYGPILQAALGLCNLTPNNTLGDGVDANDKPFLPTFPYVATPLAGYDQ